MIDTRLAWAVNVDAILEQRERNRAWLAKKIGVSESTLSRLMNHKPTRADLYLPLTFERKAAIACALDVPERLIFHSNCNGHPQKSVEPFAEEVAG